MAKSRDTTKRTWPESPAFLQVQRFFAENAARIKANPNADGWIRLVEILRKAENDNRVASSPGAMSFVELMLELAADSLTLATAEAAVQPLIDVSDEGIGNKKYRKNQSVKGTQGAKVRWAGEDRDNLNKILQRLASGRIYSDYVPSELWPVLWGELDDAGANPAEKNGDSLMDAYVIYGNDRNKLTYEAFRKSINRTRESRWDIAGP